MSKMNKKTLKVLHVTGAMNRGGAEVMLMDIYRHISNNVHFDFLVNYKINTGIQKGEFDDEIIEKGGEIKYIGAQWDIGPFKYIKAFKKIVNELGMPDVVHIHLNAKSGVIALAAKRAGIKKIIVHSHGDLVFKGSFIKNLFGVVELKVQKVLIAFFATDFWGCSPLAIKSLFYKKKIERGHTVIINNATNVDEYLKITESETLALKKKLNIDTTKIVIGAVGRLVRRKNIGFVIDVLAELNKRNIDFVFVNVGKVDDENYFKEINLKISKHQLSNKIINLGLRDDIPLVMSTFDVFVSPAYNEAFGMVAAEAQAAGLPCVLSTEFPSTIDMNLNLVSFISKFDSNLWSDKILEVNNNKCYDKKRIKEEFINLNFDISDNVKSLEKLYEK